MPKTHTDHGIEVLLDDGIDPTELDQGGQSRDDDAIDWDAVEADAADDSTEEDDR